MCSLPTLSHLTGAGNFGKLARKALSLSSSWTLVLRETLMETLWNQNTRLVSPILHPAGSAWLGEPAPTEAVRALLGFPLENPTVSLGMPMRGAGRDL